MRLVAWLVVVLAMLCLSSRAQADELPQCTFESGGFTVAGGGVELAAAHFSPSEPRRVDPATLVTAIRSAKLSTLTLKNLVVAGDLVLDDLELPGALRIEDVVVEGKLSLAELRAAKLAIARTRVQKELVLDGIRIERGVEITKSALCEGISASRPTVGTDFSVETSRICRDDTPALDPKDADASGPGFNLARAQIGGDVGLKEVHESCPLELKADRIGARLVLDRTTLSVAGKGKALDVLGTETQSGIYVSGGTLGKIHIVDLKGGFYAVSKAHLTGGAEIHSVTDGSVVMTDVDVDGDPFRLMDSSVSAVYVQNSRFHAQLFLAADKVAGIVDFYGDKAWEPWSLMGVSSGSFIELSDTHFLCDKDCTCDLSDDNCPHNQFASVEAKGGLILNQIDWGRPTLIANLQDVSLFALSDNTFHAAFTIDGAHLSGFLELGKPRIAATFKLVDVETSQLNVVDPIWEVPPEKVHFRSVKFNRLDLGKIELGKDDTAFAKAFDLLAHAAYSSDAYETTAQYIQREGRADVARELRLTSKRRELAEGRQAAGGLLRYLWKVFLYVTIGGGVAPERAFVVLFALLLFGTWWFRDKSIMVWRGRSDPPRYSSFWYTLDLLLPILKLEDARDWSPLPDHRARLYGGRIMRVVGFLMVPLLLASATGLVH